MADFDLQLWTDGASLASNLQRRAAGGIGWVLRDAAGNLLGQGNQRLAQTHTGHAEVEAACAGLAACAQYAQKRILLHTDSSEVFYLVTATKIRKRLRKRRDRLMKSFKPFREVAVKLVGRDNNVEAHRLARAALNEEDGFLHLAELLLADVKRGNFARVRGFVRQRGVNLGDPPTPERLESGIQKAERLIGAWREALAAGNKSKAKKCARLVGAELQVLAGERPVEKMMEPESDVAWRREAE